MTMDACECNECRIIREHTDGLMVGHRSDYAVHNAPAKRKSLCTCRVRRAAYVLTGEPLPSLC